MKYYLATTGISEIWDLDTDLCLLGPWCLPGEKNRMVLSNRDYLTVPSPWSTAQSIKEAADYCYKVYEEILPQFSRCLNNIHQVSYPIKYWRVIIGTWLLHFIEIAYDRYKRIENAIESIPDFYLHALPREQCELISSDTEDFVYKVVYNDYYNLKLFSIMAHQLCPQRVVEKAFKPKNIIEPKQAAVKYGLKRQIAFNLIRLVSIFQKKSIVLSDMYHLNYRDMLLLKGALWNQNLSFVDFEPSGNGQVSKDTCPNCSREALMQQGDLDKFQSLLYNLIGGAIPVAFIENYKRYKDIASSIAHTGQPKIVGSAVGWFFNESFKFFSAEASLQRTYLVEFQHGGCYGVALSAPAETLSLEKDVFFTWGWHSKDNNVKPLPSPHLSKLNDTHLGGLDNILFVGVTVPRYQYRFHTVLMCDDMPGYFEDKKLFLQALTGRMGNKVLYRPYPAEYGWDEIDAVKKMCQGTQFALKGNLYKWMQKVKLVVIDHPHTSFIEALTVNVPTILYWNHKVYLMRPEAEEYFKLLVDAGILFKDPISAAKKAQEVFNNPKEWWLNRDVQNARVRFCERFAYASKNWAKIWAEEFKSLLAKKDSQI